MLANTSTCILDKQAIYQKITRIAYEIYERNFEEKEILLAGIHENGYRLAELIANRLQEISPISITLLRIKLNKQAPLENPVTLEPEKIVLQNRVIILVDDVLNTGKTLAYSLLPFMQAGPKKIETATLIDRHHTLFPISVTYTGYSLSTTLQEHIEVVLEDMEEIGAYLV